MEDLEYSIPNMDHSLRVIATLHGSGFQDFWVSTWLFCVCAASGFVPIGLILGSWKREWKLLLRVKDLGLRFEG